MSDDSITHNMLTREIRPLGYTQKLHNNDRNKAFELLLEVDRCSNHGKLKKRYT
jgi:hypothetical protein